VHGLRRDLARLLGADALVPDEELAEYRHDGTIQRGLSGEPDAVVRPGSGEGVAAALRWCYERGVAIVPRAGGTGLAGGAVPAGGGVVVSVERLARVTALDPGLWRMSTGAGVRTADVARLARESGLLFPPDPGAAEQSRIGGNVATNAGGPHAFGRGRTGAFVTGLEAALAPGELARVGGEGRRDAAGYDLVGLMVGSEGTLGIVTAVDLRLVPAPSAAAALAAFLRDPAGGQRALLAILGSGVRPAVLDFLDARAFAAAAGAFPADPPAGFAGGMALLLEVEGSEQEVERQRGELQDALADADPILVQELPGPALWRWRDGLNGAVAAVRGGKVSEDICVPPERLADALDGIRALGAELELPACAWGHAGDGIVHASFMIDPADAGERQRGSAAGERSLALALRLGGSITGEHGVGLVKRALLGAQWDAATLSAHRRIKQALDPKGLLNPGKKEPPGRPQPAAASVVGSEEANGTHVAPA
jgi:FAD/FMN-containing dehydrogenase